MTDRVQPRVLVFSHLFPSPRQPTAGVFVRERLFRAAKFVPIVVLAPQPWFPFQSLIRRVRPHFRPMAPRYEVMQGIEVYRPRALCFPGILKRTDGILMALSCFLTARKLKARYRLNLIDAHFGYPDGYAAWRLARWLRLPLLLTLRGKEERQMRTPVAPLLRAAILGADRVVCVSGALRDIAIGVGADPERTTVIGNGVDLEKFAPMDRSDARRKLGLSEDAQVLISIGSLVERKGFHRVIECLPALLDEFPRLTLLVVGGPGPEGDMSLELRKQVSRLGLERHVLFLGHHLPEQLRVPLSAADAFVLATSYEGWANVFLEAMACGLPVLTTDVGGNRQVVNNEKVGRIVAFGDQAQLTMGLRDVLTRAWDRAEIRAYAESNSWNARIPLVVRELEELARQAATGSDRSTLETERASTN